MIAGRAAALWLGLIQAGLNAVAAAIVVITGTPLTAEMLGLFAALNAVGAAIVAVVANQGSTGTWLGKVKK
jgi:hypothetical protein